VIQPIDAATAARLVTEGAILIDIRDADEHARERIAGAHHRPLAGLGGGAPVADAAVVVFHCRSGMRTDASAALLASCLAPGGRAYRLAGGLEAWKRAGLPVERDPRQPLELMRQVQIAAGALILAGAALGFLVASAWFLLPTAVGAGLVFAGVSGTCGLARVLVRMPWNRAMRPGAGPASTRATP